MKHYNNMARQAGMTLIELTVVLLILIGLAGLLVPYVGSFTQTTHDSTNSNNLTQLNNAVGRYVTDKNKLPPHVDTLINGLADAGTAGGACAGATAGAVYCGLANPGLFTPATFAAGSTQAQSLAASGINMAVANDPNAQNKTFGTSTGMLMLGDPAGGAYADGSAVFAAVQGVTGVGGVVGGMLDYTDSTEAHLAQALGRDAMVYSDTCYDYIAVGIGDNNELIQSTMAAAPVYFPQDAQFGPQQAYGHFIAILQVDAANTGNDAINTTRACSTITEPAKFLGIVANVPTTESAALVGVNTLLAQGWNNRAAAN
ncbi:type II secretion system protein [Methylobacter sp.]|jgi:type II secretory pathway pseudopilin PulG|uniref:type II secretion system protein n=1 Tax=Methylobacter sp. TaxID=2051955 RepID=UPI003DA23974